MFKRFTLLILAISAIILFALSFTPAKILADTLPWGSAKTQIITFSDGSKRAFWVSNTIIYESSYDPNRVVSPENQQTWSPASPVASGIEPRALIGKNKDIELVYSRNTAGNYEIYHKHWSAASKMWGTLSFAISITPGDSRHPRISTGSDGKLWVVWEDKTPGYSVIYAGNSLSETSWGFRPVPSAAGTQPVVSVIDNRVEVVFTQNAAINSIASSTFQNGNWSNNPQVISFLNVNSHSPNLYPISSKAVKATWKTGSGDYFSIKKDADSLWTAPVKI